MEGGSIAIKKESLVWLSVPPLGFIMLKIDCWLIEPFRRYIIFYGSGEIEIPNTLF